LRITTCCRQPKTSHLASIRLAPTHNPFNYPQNLKRRPVSIWSRSLDKQQRSRNNMTTDANASLLVHVTAIFSRDFKKITAGHWPTFAAFRCSLFV
jgi:hypothetical protein